MNWIKLLEVSWNHLNLNYSTTLWNSWPSAYQWGFILQVEPIQIDQNEPNVEISEPKIKAMPHR